MRVAPAQSPLSQLVNATSSAHDDQFWEVRQPAPGPRRGAACTDLLSRGATPAQELQRSVREDEFAHGSASSSAAPSASALTGRIGYDSAANLATLNARFFE